MFKHRANGANRDRVNRASSACVACPDGSPLLSGVCSLMFSWVIWSSLISFPVSLIQVLANLQFSNVFKNYFCESVIVYSL